MLYTTDPWFIAPVDHRCYPQLVSLWHPNDTVLYAPMYQSFLLLAFRQAMYQRRRYVYSYTALRELNMADHRWS